MNRPRINTITNPACIEYGEQIFSEEIYSIEGIKNSDFFKRKRAIEYTIELAKGLGRDLTLLINKSPFYLVKSNGRIRCIYRPEEDKITHPQLKQFYINRGYVHPHYKGLMAA